jgi:WhiB family redox-sensing transcriptional regulator
VTRRHGPQVLCLCGVPVDLAWAARTGRTTHLACDPPAAVPAVTLAEFWAADPEPVLTAPMATPVPPQTRPRAPQPPAPVTGRAVTSLADLADETVHDPADELEWQERALCAQTDPEAFFPEKGGSTREAKAVCNSCEVRLECLKYAFDNDERFGIWGGLSERERRKAKRLVEAS